jgi:hypothetical protein
MFDPGAWRGLKARAAKRWEALSARLDPICARMNGGLAAVAVALALAVCVLAAARAPVLLAERFDLQARHAVND